MSLVEQHMARGAQHTLLDYCEFMNFCLVNFDSFLLTFHNFPSHTEVISGFTITMRWPCSW